MTGEVPALAWIGFFALVCLVLAVEAVVFPRTPHVVRLREAEWLAVLWVTVAGGFGVVVAAWLGTARAAEYATGYLKSLDLAHVFAFSLVFGVFGLPRHLQRRVLTLGVLVALPVRLVVALAGAAVLTANAWLVPVLGVVLLAAAVEALRFDESHMDERVRRLAGRLHRFAADYDAERLATRRAGKLVLTPLALVLVAIEATDLLFSADSFPGLLAVSREPFVVYTSNALATITLRALYFVLADLRDRFRYWRAGMAAALAFVGAKLLLSGFVKVDPLVSLGVIGLILAVTVTLSLARSAPPGDPDEGSRDG